MIQDRLTAKFLTKKAAAPKVKAKKKTVTAYRAPSAVDVYLAGSDRTTTVWL